MRFIVLATDFDGTLADRGHVDAEVWTAIRRLRDSGRTAVMVTGRELEDLQTICPHLDLFDRVVAENGALIYEPKTKEVRVLGEPPPANFTASLAALGVTPLSVGHVIVATVKPFETAVLNVINELGLELQVIFNQDSVMVLPTGVNKATGLAMALKELGFSPHNAVAIGDAENDHALLSACECGVAVGNAVPALKQRADFVTRGGPGASVVELINQMLADDLRTIGQRITRHDILLGARKDGREFRIPPHGINLLIAGRSGSGKSVLAAGLLERLLEAKYQYAVVDPEGDYAAAPGSVVLGSSERAPLMDEVLNLLLAGRNAVINLLGIPLGDRPIFFHQLLPKLLDLRSRLGRPHWLFVDESHHLMPTTWSPPPERIPGRLHGTAMVTVHPGSVSPAALSGIDLLVALGQDAETALMEFCRARRTAIPSVPGKLENGQALAYWPARGESPIALTTVSARTEQRRHRRKYAEGRLPDDRSFVFHGPRGKLNLRAHNLMTFLELAEGVDDATFLHHLKAHDYSRWFRDAIKDDDLARDVESLESRYARDAAGGRQQIRAAIEHRYTLPASVPSGSA